MPRYGEPPFYEEVQTASWGLSLVIDMPVVACLRLIAPGLMLQQIS